MARSSKSKRRTTTPYRLTDTKLPARIGYDTFLKGMSQSEARAKSTEVAQTLFKEIADALIEDGEVYMDGIGYFCHVRSIKPSLYRKWLGGKTKIASIFEETKGYFYDTVLFTDTTIGNPLEGWFFEGSMANKLKKRRLEALLIGKKYKFNYTTIKNYYGNKNSGVFRRVERSQRIGKQFVRRGIDNIRMGASSS